MVYNFIWFLIFIIEPVHIYIGSGSQYLMNPVRILYCRIKRCGGLTFNYACNKFYFVQEPAMVAAAENAVAAVSEAEAEPTAGPSGLCGKWRVA